MVQEKVLTWLEKTGFPLEMTAAAAFREAGFEVQQSATYADPTTRKSREIDVLATDPDLIGFVTLSVVVECKASTKPWVVLVADDALAHYHLVRTFAVMSSQARVALQRGKLDDLKISGMLPTDQRCGYALRQAFSDKDDDPGYSSAAGLLSACMGSIPTKTTGDWPVVQVVMPVLVVDSPLFECELQTDGSLKLVEVEQSTFLFSTHAPDHVLCLVRVVRRSKLSWIASWAKQAMDCLRKDLSHEEDRIIEHLDDQSKMFEEDPDATPM